MKKLIFLIFMCVFLCACGDDSEENSVSVYRVYSEEHQVNGELLVKEPVVLEENDINTVLYALSQSPTDVRAYNPLGEIDEISGTVSDGTATVILSADFNELDDFDKTLSCAVLTLSICSLPEVERVDVLVGETVFASELVTADMLLYDTTIDPSRLDISLYFSNESGDMLIPEYRTLSIDENSQPERYIIEELLSPSEESGLKSPIPEGTELLGIASEGKSCTINFSSEFLINKPKTATGEIITIYSIVNSLTFLSNVSEVIITVEGETIDKYVNLSLSAPLTKLSLISATDGRESYFAKLYFAYGEALFGVPSIINSTADNAQAVLDKLMLAPSFGSYTSLFTSSDELNHVETLFGTCTVSVSRSFFESRTENEVSLAVDAIVKTLVDLEEVNAVELVYSNGNSPIMEELELDKILLDAKAEIIE